MSANHIKKPLKPRQRSSEDAQAREALKRAKGDRKSNKEMENMSELEKKDVIIDGLQSTVNILHMKIAKLEQLLNLKQQKIQYLENSMNGG